MIGIGGALYRASIPSRPSVIKEQHVRSAVLVIVGTRPEAIKLAPIVNYWRTHCDPANLRVCAVAQQKDILIRALNDLKIAPDYHLHRIPRKDVLIKRVAAMIERLHYPISDLRPQVVVVHGDTTTALAGAIAAACARVPVAHIEAGLRTGDMSYPFPEEMNRVLIDRIASVHYAPSESSRQNLLREGMRADSVVVSGNTFVDALQMFDTENPPLLSGSSTKQLLVTLHRRDNIPHGIQEICRSLIHLTLQHTELEIKYILHANPKARSCAKSLLRNVERIRMHEPLSYQDFIRALQSSFLVLTDSGGVQEEAAHLGIPTLVARSTTERTELVEMGASTLVGRDASTVVSIVSRLLGDAQLYRDMRRPARPYGDGNAARRICDDLQYRLTTGEFSR